MIHRPS